MKAQNTRERWLEWQKSGQAYVVDGQRFYWAFDHLFEKCRGRTSVRVPESRARHLFSEMKQQKGSFEPV